MEWVDGLRGQLVALDTAPLIYFIEEHPRYCPVVAPFFEQLDKGLIRAATSVITLSEVLVKPLRNGDARLTQQYREILLNAEGLTTVEVSAAMQKRQPGCGVNIRCARRMRFRSPRLCTQAHRHC